ncbi:MAG: helix-turn-helix domain-containing protein [Actinomycetota bacterium]|nr:helix-turn-helix domain-containing protein [Actinomycetota bacterium]
MSADRLSITVPPELEERIAQRAAAIVLERLERSENGSAPSPYLSISEAADYARCDRQRIYDLRSSGRLSRIGDGTRALVLRAELDEYLGEGS